MGGAKVRQQRRDWRRATMLWLSVWGVPGPRFTVGVVRDRWVVGGLPTFLLPHQWKPSRGSPFLAPRPQPLPCRRSHQRRLLRLMELALVEVGLQAALRQEFLMCSPLDDAAALQR
jgi:hypothetical protein